jgi:alkylation response protein AidB-like acyl-CoA dehydrogenase
MTTTDPNWLIKAREMADNVLWPAAQASDQAGTPPVGNIRRLAEAGLLGVNVPVEFGGQGGGMGELGDLFEALASGCGVTTFVALQHMLACSYLARSANNPLKVKWLKELGAGRTFASVAFSQVRRPGPPMVRCVQRGDCYVFDGTAPWSTGWGVARQVVLGGTLEDGHLVFAFVPTSVPGMTASEPMKLCAMNASSTVTLSCKSVEAPLTDIIKIITREELAKSDQRGMFLIAHLSHGVTRASLRHLASLQAQRPSDAVTGVITRIQSQLEKIKGDAAAWVERADDPEYASRAVRVRAASVSLSLCAAQAAVMASGGTAIALEHPAQRLFREAMLYSLTAQTRDLQSTMLDHVA